MRSSLTVLLIILGIPYICFGCLLCPLHIPARPKALDQFRLPSIQKLVQTAESIEWLCQNGSRLKSMSSECRAETSHLFCSLSQLVLSLKTECPGPEEPSQCSQCRAENDLLYNRNKWILTWVDSVGKMPSGISDGNYHWLGDYEQCQRLKKQRKFNGRYCLLEFRVPDAVLRPEQCLERDAEPLEVVLGICLPANCSAQETQELVEYVAAHRPIQVNCEPATIWPLPGLLLIGLCILWLVALLAMSVLRWFHPSLCLPPALAALCLQPHLRHSLRTTFPVHFQAIPGIQVLTIGLLVLGQAQVLVMPYLENIGHHYALLESWLAQPVLNPTLLADSVLALSAFQLATSRTTGGIRPTMCQTIWLRFLRFWPAYALITLSMAFVFAHLGDGPMWSRTDIAQRCAANWPVNLLLVQNLLGYFHTCLDVGQLLALDAQFVLFSLLALHLCSPQSPRALPVLLLALLAFNCSFLLAVSLLFLPGGLPPTLLPHRRMEAPQFGPLVDLLVLNPLARAGPPLIGLLFATRLSPHLTGSWAHLLRVFAPLGSLLAVVGIALLLCAPSWLHPPMAATISSSSSSFSSPTALLYAIFHRPVWAALVLSLVLFAESAKDGVLAKFLGWRIFRPLAKQLFPVLLLAEPVCLSLFASLHRPILTTPLSAILSFVGILVCSFLLAFAVDIALTRPIRQLMFCCCKWAQNREEIPGTDDKNKKRTANANISFSKRN